ncbi:MAG: PH domain-containing protein [Thermoflexaceae bacterium]|nr:PH domain-containing protein [Thermoflexaceae bacterium]
MKLPFDLQAGETMLLLSRRHWLFLWSKLVAVALIGVLPVVAVTWLVGATAGFDGLAGKAVLVFDVLWAAYWLVRLYFTWYRYNRDMWVVTDQRLVDSIRRHWFHHRMASADLVDIEDIAVVREGILPTLFNFGDVRCQTAGEQPNFVLAGIPAPTAALGVIDAARDAARRQLGRPS